MRVSQITEENITDDIIDRLLYEGLEYTDEKADCIIVLGSTTAVKYRVPKAVDVYMSGRCNKIMMCGGAIKNIFEKIMAEAEHMKEKAMELGVPEEGIILESNSQNTIENILCALLELQRNFYLNKIKRVILVTTTYHMRRSLHIARYLFPEHIKVIPCPADDTNTKRDNWMKNEAGTKRARMEAMKIVICVRNGVIPDFEI